MSHRASNDWAPNNIFLAVSEDEVDAEETKIVPVPSTSLGLVEYAEEPKRIRLPDDDESLIVHDNESLTSFEDAFDNFRISTPDYPPPDPPSDPIDPINLTIDEKELPKRKYPQQARRPDDVIGKVILFTIWLCFISSRILSLSVFACFFKPLTFEFLGVQFLITFIVILLYTKSSNVRFVRNLDWLIQYLFLSYVYLFCLIEFRIKFKYFYRTFVFYFIVMFTENLIITIVWYLADWDDTWWFNYLFTLIVFSKVMCILFIAMYILLLKQKKEIIYINKT